MKPIVLNQSYMKTFADCQRLYGWIRLQNLDTPRRRSATEIGTAVHEGLAVFHAVGGTKEAAMIAANESLKASASTGPQVGFEDKSLEEAKEIMNRVIPAYFDHWGMKDDLWAPIGIEVAFLVEVGTDTGVYLRGKSDNLSVHAGALYLVDYKTAGRMDPRDLLKYEIDMQLSAYIYGLSKQLSIDSVKEGGDPVRVQGAIIDLLVKTKTPQFARETYTRTDEELLEFEQEFIEVANRIRSQLERVEKGENWKIVFPKNTNHCFQYGTCRFRDLCVKDTPIRRAAYDTRSPDYVDEGQAEIEKALKGEDQ